MNQLNGVLQALREGRAFGNDDGFAGGDVWGRLECSEGAEAATLTLKAFGPDGARDFGALKKFDRVAFVGEIVQGRPYTNKHGLQVTPLEVHVVEYRLAGPGEAPPRRELPVAKPAA